MGFELIQNCYQSLLKGCYFSISLIRFSRSEVGLQLRLFECFQTDCFSICTQFGRGYPRPVHIGLETLCCRSKPAGPCPCLRTQDVINHQSVLLHESPLSMARLPHSCPAWLTFLACDPSIMFYDVYTRSSHCWDDPPTPPPHKRIMYT